LNLEEDDLKFIDKLTGVYTKDFFFESGNKMLFLAKRNKVPMSICMIDIDDLQNINDTYSYAEGNKVLEAIGHIILRECRESDLVGYFGEGKIGIILYNVSGINTNIMLNTLRQKIEYDTDIMGQKEISVTVSIGASVMHNLMNTKTLDAAYDQAYMATNVAKEKGKNRVIIY